MTTYQSRVTLQQGLGAIFKVLNDNSQFMPKRALADICRAIFESLKFKKVGK